jgi:hypothetical protein
VKVRGNGSGTAKGGPWRKGNRNTERRMRGGAARSTQWTAHAARLLLAVHGALRHAHSRVLDYSADPWRVWLFLMSAPPELPVIARERAPRHPCLHALARCGDSGSPAHASRPRRMLTDWKTAPCGGGCGRGGETVVGALPAMNLKAGDSFDDMPASFSPSRLVNARKHGKYGYCTAPLCCCHARSPRSRACSQEGLFTLVARDWGRFSRLLMISSDALLECVLLLNVFSCCGRYSRPSMNSSNATPSWTGTTEIKYLKLN